jgi:23S rRNA pseudouridine1911/1915/1917 synthase
MHERVIIAGAADSGKRLDVFVAEQDATLSRSHIQQLIKNGYILVDGARQKASFRLNGGATISVDVPEAAPVEACAEPLPVDIVFEDEWLVVVNKAAGMVVHPGAGNPAGTLVNALLHHCHALAGIGGALRPGIVHRLDRDTSGVLVVAKSDRAYHGLREQFSQHTITRQYHALVYGRLSDMSGVIDTPIGRDRVDRKRMSTRSRHGRPARTLWRVLETFAEVTHLEATLETGRTHQVRVHCASIGHPLVGDCVYGTARRVRSVAAKPVQDALKQITRHMLHAGLLAFDHPVSGARMTCTAALPADFAHVLAVLRDQGC